MSAMAASGGELRRRVRAPADTTSVDKPQEEERKDRLILRLRLSQVRQ